MKFVQWLSDAIFSIERILAVIIMIVMLGSIAAGVTYRYFLNSPLSWPEELAIFMLVWVTFVGGSMSIKRQQSAAVSLFIDRLKPMMRKILLIIGFGLITSFSIYIAYLSINWIAAPSVLMQKSTALGITMFYPYLAIPVGFFCMSIHSLNFFLRSFSASGEVES